MRVVDTSGIYAILNAVNGKIYVGSAVRLKARWRTHRHALRKGDHGNRHLQNAWNLYGEESFFFYWLEFVEPGNLLDREQTWMDDLLVCDRDIGYNLAPNARSQLGLTHSAETRAKISLNRKGKGVGRVLTQETRDKISAAKLGRKQSAEHIEKLAARRRGLKTGPRSEEVKARISESLARFYETPEGQQKKWGKALERLSRLRAFVGGYDDTLR